MSLSKSFILTGFFFIVAAVRALSHREESVIFPMAPLGLVKVEKLPLFFLAENLTIARSKDYALTWGKDPSTEVKSVELLHKGLSSANFIDLRGAQYDTAHATNLLENAVHVEIENVKKWNKLMPENLKIIRFKNGKLVGRSLATGFI